MSGTPACKICDKEDAASSLGDSPVLRLSLIHISWFAGTPTPEEVKAYDHFICALCEMARNQKRITAKERDTGNDKYAFRCFLLRLGFIGPEFKQERKILLRNLTGSSAFRAVPQKEVADDAASE